MESAVLPALGLTAFALLLIVTGGVAYLTISGWQDRRRREIDRRR